MGDMAVCTKCGRVLPVEAFNRDAAQPSGRSSACSECRTRAKRVKRNQVGWRGPTGSLRLPPGMKL